MGGGGEKEGRREQWTGNSSRVPTEEETDYIDKEGKMGGQGKRGGEKRK